MITVQTAPRVIRYNGRVLADLNPAEPDVDAIVRMHMLACPELATAHVEGPVMENGEQVYTVTSRRGDKG
jgi:PRTRC genetic system protein C